jgi:hypothetical protein
VAAHNPPENLLYCSICNGFQYAASIMTTSLRQNLVDLENFYSDVATNQLPAISFVKPDSLVDGHPGTSTPALHEPFVRKIVNAVRANGQLWSDTAILITFDEAGGLYDSGYIQPIDWLDAFESIVSLCMAKAKLVWKNLDDLPNLRQALLEVHVNVSTAGIPYHLGITLLAGRGIANPSSTMPRCSPLRVESQDGRAVLAIGRGHLPSASEDVTVRWVVVTLDAVDQRTECRECNQDRGDEQALLCARPGVCEGGASNEKEISHDRVLWQTH